MNVTVYLSVSIVHPENGPGIKTTPKVCCELNIEPHEIALLEGKNGRRSAISCGSYGKQKHPTYFVPSPLLLPGVESCV